MYLKFRTTEGKGEGVSEREIDLPSAGRYSPIFFLFPNIILTPQIALMARAWVRLKAGARNCIMVSHVGTGANT